MINKQADLFEQLFGKSMQEASGKNMLQQIIKDHPYFSPAHFFLLQQMHKGDESYENQAAITNLFFNNPHWLDLQVNQKKTIPNTDNISFADTQTGSYENIITQATEQKNIASKAEQGTNGIPEKTQQENTITAQTIQLKPTEDKLIFEPLFASDYFASQGIKINEQVTPTDKLGKQLKSFTDWLKTMKKIHTEKQFPDNDITDITVQKLAEKSNTDEDILTEAMAEVFAKQNKTSKAIEVYEKLSLLNPSKSAYFAAKIEQLKGI